MWELRRLFVGIESDLERAREVGGTSGTPADPVMKGHSATAGLPARFVDVGPER